MKSSFDNHKLIELIARKDTDAYEISRKYNVAYMTLYDIVEGKVTNPRINTLYKIADALNVDIKDLL